MSTHTLRLLSYNIQAGIETRRYRHYLYRGWQHLLPNRERERNLSAIAGLLAHYDVVALQEADGGSRRTGRVNQVEYLARVGRFPFWYSQTNRNIGDLARPGNGLLSRLEPVRVEAHDLPGLIPGRGALCAVYGEADRQLAVVSLHLALGYVSQRVQMDYIATLVSEFPWVVVMGDLNMDTRSRALQGFLVRSGLRGQPLASKTFPSWRPRRGLDHILMSPGLELVQSGVLDFSLSDHLPVMAEIRLPFALPLKPTAQVPAGHSESSAAMSRMRAS